MSAPPTGTDLAQADVAHTGADLSAVCCDAALRALPDPVTQHHLNTAVTSATPSAMRSVAARPVATPWDAIGGLAAVKDKLRQAVEWPVQHAAAFRRLALSPTRGILLHGPPGCSKTTLVRAVATASGAALFSLSGADVYSPYVGDAERAVREAFQRARAAPPSIVFLDEVDAMVGRRGLTAATVSSASSSGVLATLLNEMDGVEWVPGVLVIGATNRPAALDPALLRPGRFELSLEVPLPDEAGRCEILEVHTRRMPLATDVSLASIARATDTFSGAELQAVCREAAVCATA